MPLGARDRLTAAFHAAAIAPTDSDAELLGRFVADRSEPAFQAIVRRHGGIVLDVSRSILRNDADADDAFQAVFITLALRAKTIRKRESLASWLHGVAFRTAMRCRRNATRRRKHEGKAESASETPIHDPSWSEVREAIHREVNALPEKARDAIVLCYLQGRTQAQASSALGISVEAVKKRLEAGRRVLRDRLIRRGFGPVAVLAASLITIAPAPTALAASASSVALEIIGNPKAASVLPASIHELIEKGTNMFTAMKLSASSVAFAGLLGLAISIDWREPNATATAAPGPQPERKDQPLAVKTELEGKWKVINISDKDEDVPDKEYAGLKFTFTKGQLKLGFYPDASQKNWNPDYLQGAKFRLDSEKPLKEIDLKLDPKFEKNTDIRGVYQLKDGQLLIAVRTMQSIKLPRPKGYST